MRRIGILLAALGLILVIGVGLLVMRALESIAEEEELRHEVVASRLFDELERELTVLLAREEERSFLEYRTLFVPEEQVPGNPSLSVSPLASGPTDPYVVGWYQVEPDGALNLPWRPRPFEQEYAENNALVLGNSAPGASDAERTIEQLAEPLVQPVRDAWNARLDEVDADSSSGDLKKQVEGFDDGWVTVSDAPAPTTSKRNPPAKESADEDERPVLKTEEPPPADASPTSTLDATGSTTATVESTGKDDGGEVVDERHTGEEERRYREEEARRDEAEQQAVQRELDEADQQAETEDMEGPVALGTSSKRGPPAPKVGGRKKKRKPTAQSNSDRDVLESLNRGGSSRAQRQTKSSAYSSDSAELFKNDQEVGVVQGEVDFEPTPEEASEELALAAGLDADGELDDEDADGPLAAPEAAAAPAGGDGEAAAPAPEPEAVAEAPPEPTPEPAPPVQAVEAPKPQRQRRRVPKKEPAPPPEPVELLVTVSPFTSYRPDPQHLVLHRDVHVGPDRYVQGLVVRLPELMEHLHTTVVDTDIEDAVQIAWPDIGIETGEPVEPRFAFDHTFAEPFGSVTAAASLGTLPRQGRDPRSWVVFLAILLASVGTLGFAGIYRSTAVVVHFAERRNNFVAAVTHELKTPLTAIRMYAEILRDGMVSSDAKRQEYYGTITTESDRLGRLINNVLELSNLEKGSRPMRLEVGSIATVLDEVARILGPHARDRGFTLVSDVPEDLPPAKFDRDALLQVVINLVDNAIKFSATSDDKTILLTASENTITIRDHGPGVPQAQLNRIFQPFFRGERELVRNTKGTGIGLALVRGLVEQMGGRVIARNHPSGGFEVSIAL